MNVGDRISIECKDSRSYEGILLPSEHDDSIVVKLNNGYNVGILSSSIKAKKVVEKHKEQKLPAPDKIKENKKLPLVSILHTGGTIASKVDYRTGGVIARFTPEELIAKFPELKDIARIRSSLIANMWSEDMRFGHYKLMAEKIKEEIKAGSEGIIITHGTDTLHYTAAALSFMFEKLPVPIILVGAQRSSDRASSDAGINLISAVFFIANTDFAEVAICMHETSDDDAIAILPGVKTRKLHTSRRDAFKPVNDRPIARINPETKDIKFLKQYNKKGKELLIKDKFEDKVGLLKIHTNFDSQILDFYRENKYKGLVIEATGLGHMPINAINDIAKPNKKIFESLKKLAKDCIVVITSQCVYGRVHLNVYSTGIDMKNAGVISGEDMTSETAFIKLAWVLGNEKNAKDFVDKNLRGEISERTLYD